MTKPFRATYGFDAHGNRGINLAKPIDDEDFAQKLWVEEQIAAQSRLKGTYTPDSDGLQTPAPDLDALVPEVDVLTADYWVTDLSGRASSGPMAYVDLNSDDRLVATNSTGGATAVTLAPSPATGLLADAHYRVEVDDPAYAGKGQSLALVLGTDPTGAVSTVDLVNAGYNYEVGDTLNTVIPNNFANSIETIAVATPGTFTLLPNTTYYTASITGGTGTNFVANFRTDAAGTAISDVFLIDRGVGYTAADLLTVEIEGQTVGTWTVGTVYSGTDVPLTVTVDAVALRTGWDLIRGAGLTRAQADQDYLRLDGANSPSRDIDFNQQGITNLKDPLNPQDAVNLRSLRSNSNALFYEVTQVAHGFTTGQAVYFQLGGGWALAQADTPATLAWGPAIVTSPDTFEVVMQGRMSFPAHGFGIGDDVYLSQTTAGDYVSMRPPYGFQQMVFIPLDADTVHVVGQAAQEV